MTASNPFANLNSGNTANSDDAVEESPEEAVDTSVEDALREIDGFLSGMKLEIPEECIAVRTSSTWYRPAHMVVAPMKISAAKLAPRESEISIAVTPDGKRIILAHDVEKALESGTAEEVIAKMKLPCFELEFDLAGECFGENRWPYRWNAPAIPVRMANRNAKERKKSWLQISGPNLVRATRAQQGVIEPTVENLAKLAEAMVGKIVMAQFKWVAKKNPKWIPRLDEEGNSIKVLIDQHGTKAKLLKDGKGGLMTESEEAVVKDGDSLSFPFDGEAITVEASRLFKQDDHYLVRDYSGNGDTLRVPKPEYWDNLQRNLLEAPSRNITVTRTGNAEESVEAEVTWDTVAMMMPRDSGGFMTTGGVRVGTLVQAMTKDGELITASWMGTFWRETERQYELAIIGDQDSGYTASLKQMAPSGGAGPDASVAPANFEGDAPKG